jgi:hypothetical protein
MTNNLQEAMQRTDKSFDEYLEETHGYGKRKTERIKPVAHITFEYAPHQCVTIMTHGILEISTTLPPKQAHSIMLLHTAGTVQILGEALDTLAIHLRNMQVHHLTIGNHENGGVVQKIVVNGGINTT